MKVFTLKNEGFLTFDSAKKVVDYLYKNADAYEVAENDPISNYTKEQIINMIYEYEFLMLNSDCETPTEIWVTELP